MQRGLNLKCCGHKIWKLNKDPREVTLSRLDIWGKSISKYRKGKYKDPKTEAKLYPCSWYKFGSLQKTPWYLWNGLCVCVCVHSVTSVMSNSLWPYRLQPTRLLCPQDSPSKNTGVGCHALLQGIFLTQGLNLHLLHCRQILYHWATGESQDGVEMVKSIAAIPYCHSNFFPIYLAFQHFP